MFDKNSLDNIFSAMIGDNDTKILGLGVIAFKNAQEIYSYFGGRRHINPNKKMTRKTLLRAASLSKMFTAFAIMQLVERGKLNLSDDVSDFLDFKLRNPHFPDKIITVEMLACHTSSLRDEKPKFADKMPGKFFTYCNFNYVLLGTIIERVSGERFDIYQQNHILKPLNIDGGYLVSNLSPNAFKNLGTIYRKQNFWLPQVDDYKFQPKNDLSGYKIGSNAEIFAPQGGLRISFDDLAKVLLMLMNKGTYNGKKIICADSFNQIISPHWTFNEKFPNGDTYGGVMENYGLGTYKIGGKSRARLCKDFEIDLIGHSGEAYGLISGLYFIPNTKNGVIFMINGTAIDIDDKKALGKFSSGYIWEENVMNPLLTRFFLRT